MAIINLQDYYPKSYASDYLIEVSDNIADLFSAERKREAAYERRKYYCRAQYSLDRDDGIEKLLLRNETSAEDTFERESTITQILTIMATLPEKHARRIYALYFLGVDKPTIAKAEGITKRALNISIQCGLRQIKEKLKKFL